LTLERALQDDNPLQLLLCQYTQSLFRAAAAALSRQHTLASPLVTTLLPPLLHALCLCANRATIAEAVLPSLVVLCAVLRDSETLCPTVAAEAAAAMAALRRGDIASAAACGMAAEPKGWRVVPAAFEQDEGADSFYSVSLLLCRL
jgi:hypothetical protein